MEMREREKEREMNVREGAKRTIRGECGLGLQARLIANRHKEIDERERERYANKATC